MAKTIFIKTIQQIQRTHFSEIRRAVTVPVRGRNKESMLSPRLFKIGQEKHGNDADMYISYFYHVSGSVPDLDTDPSYYCCAFTGQWIFAFRL